MKPRSSKSLDRGLELVRQTREMYDYPWATPTSEENLRDPAQMILVFKAIYADYLRRWAKLDADIAECEIAQFLQTDLGARLQAYWELDIDEVGT